MNTKLKTAQPYAGSTLRQGITAVVAILGTMDLIPESEADAITAALVVLVNIAWALHAKHKAIHTEPPKSNKVKS
jgi:hypothetical protein